MTYKVKSGPNGQTHVLFPCPICKADLKAPLDEAGQVFACPTCSRQIVTPGSAALDQRRQEQAAKQLREEQERIERQSREAEAEEAARAAEAHRVEQRRQREAERVAKAEMVSPKRGGVPLAVFILTIFLIIITLIAGCVRLIRPLQMELADTKDRLEATDARLFTLTNQIAVDLKALHATIVADQTAMRADFAVDLKSLTATVNHNAKTTNSLRTDMISLSSDLASVNRTANNANNHAHSHSRW